MCGLVAIFVGVWLLSTLVFLCLEFKRQQLRKKMLAIRVELVQREINIMKSLFLCSTCLGSEFKSTLLPCVHTLGCDICPIFQVQCAFCQRQANEGIV